MAVDWDAVGAIAGIAGAVLTVAAMLQSCRYARKAERARRDESYARAMSTGSTPSTAANVQSQPDRQRVGAQIGNAVAASTSPDEFADRAVASAQLAAKWEDRKSRWRTGACRIALATATLALYTLFTTSAFLGSTSSFSYVSGDQPDFNYCDHEYCFWDLDSIEWDFQNGRRTVSTTLRPDGVSEFKTFSAHVYQATDCPMAAVTWTVHTNSSVLASGEFRGRQRSDVDVAVPPKFDELHIEARRTDGDSCDSTFVVHTPRIDHDGPYPWN